MWPLDQVSETAHSLLFNLASPSLRKSLFMGPGFSLQNLLGFAASRSDLWQELWGLGLQRNVTPLGPSAIWSVFCLLGHLIICTWDMHIPRKIELKQQTESWFLSDPEASTHLSFALSHLVTVAFPFPLSSKVRTRASDMGHFHLSLFNTKYSITKSRSQSFHVLASTKHIAVQKIPS